MHSRMAEHLMYDQSSEVASATDRIRERVSSPPSVIDTLLSETNIKSMRIMLIVSFGRVPKGVRVVLASRDRH
jgi:hypothetical protein